MLIKRQDITWEIVKLFFVKMLTSNLFMFSVAQSISQFVNEVPKMVRYSIDHIYILGKSLCLNEINSCLQLSLAQWLWVDWKTKQEEVSLDDGHKIQKLSDSLYSSECSKCSRMKSIRISFCTLYPSFNNSKTSSSFTFVFCPLLKTLHSKVTVIKVAFLWWQ